MTVQDVRKDVENHSLTIVAEYPATVGRVWQLWADPRQLERWWGPPGYPSTFTEHDLTTGGHVRYFMTGPDGDRFHGGWRVLGAEPPHRLEVRDFFADDDGGENHDMPAATMVVAIEDAGSGATRMTINSTWDSAAEMEKVLAMGMEEGIREALGQIDALLAERPGE
ncbi:SRPBCC family protein [Miltoncostaea oceani]|uniref:SRPBCC family protein n=1 Tax=Miltoncostaea oceani TaxID=2843216 RepID=UPI001C3E5FFA|nr:SRPBCC domain-containing protein [Miltoncostaea oceani]